MPDELTTSPKTIVITGSSDGIGAAAARQLRQDGHQLVIVGRSPGKTLAVAREIGADHYLADFTRLDEVRKLAAELDATYPRIDMLANKPCPQPVGTLRTADRPRLRPVGSSGHARRASSQDRPKA